MSRTLANIASRRRRFQFADGSVVPDPFGRRELYAVDTESQPTGSAEQSCLGVRRWRYLGMAHGWRRAEMIERRQVAAGTRWRSGTRKLSWSGSRSCETRRPGASSGRLGGLARSRAAVSCAARVRGSATRSSRGSEAASGATASSWAFTRGASLAGSKAGSGWRSCMAPASRQTIPSRSERRGGAELSQLVRSTSLPEVVDDFCFDSLRRLLTAASWRVEQADGGLSYERPMPPRAENTALAAGRATNRKPRSRMLESATPSGHIRCDVPKRPRTGRGLGFRSRSAPLGRDGRPDGGAWR